MTRRLPPRLWLDAARIAWICERRERGLCWWQIAYDLGAELGIRIGVQDLHHAYRRWWLRQLKAWEMTLR